LNTDNESLLMTDAGSVWHVEMTAIAAYDCQQNADDNEQQRM